MGAPVFRIEIPGGRPPSQLLEWLPWVGRHQFQPARSLDEWRGMLRARLERRNRELGIAGPRLAEATDAMRFSMSLRRCFSNAAANSAPLVNSVYAPR